MVLLNCQSHFINAFTHLYFEIFLVIHVLSNPQNVWRLLFEQNTVSKGARRYCLAVAVATTAIKYQPLFYQSKWHHDLSFPNDIPHFPSF